MAKGNPKIFRQLVSENLIDRFGQAEGGLTRRLTAQAGGLQFTSTRKNEVPLGPKYNDAGERLYYWVPSLEGQTPLHQPEQTMIDIVGCLVIKAEVVTLLKQKSVKLLMPTRE